MKNRTIILIFVVIASFVVVMSNLYSLRKALIFLILIIIGIVFTSLPLLYIGKMLKLDMKIMKNGEKLVQNMVLTQVFMKITVTIKKI